MSSHFFVLFSFRNKKVSNLTSKLYSSGAFISSIAVLINCMLSLCIKYVFSSHFSVMNTCILKHSNG